MLEKRRNLAVGYYFNGSFREACRPWFCRIGEVFFAWPGVLTCRPAPDFTDELKSRLIDDLKWCKRNGMRLDVLFNCSCYGDLAISHELEMQVCRVFEELDESGIFPDVVTTTSPFVAHLIRRDYPKLKIRASVNMRINGTAGFEVLSDIFDEFYLSREWQRDFSYVKAVSRWANENGKLLGMQVNSGCLRDCPYQNFHDNLHGHPKAKYSSVLKDFDFSYFRCKTRYGNERAFEDFIRATWVRPEDTHLWEECISVFKLATRKTEFPEKIIAAYASYGFDGNLLELMDPMHAELFAPAVIDNKRFPEDWGTSGIGTACAHNCTHCGKCANILSQVMVK